MDSNEWNHLWKRQYMNCYILTLPVETKTHTRCTLLHQNNCYRHNIPGSSSAGISMSRRVQLPVWPSCPVVLYPTILSSLVIGLISMRPTGSKSSAKNYNAFIKKTRFHHQEHGEKSSAKCRFSKSVDHLASRCWCLLSNCVNGIEYTIHIN